MARMLSLRQHFESEEDVLMVLASSKSVGVALLSASAVSEALPGPQAMYITSVHCVTHTCHWIYTHCDSAQVFRVENIGHESIHQYKRTEL